MFFFFAIEINTDTINSSIKLEKDKKTSCLQQISVGFVSQGSKLLWLIKRPDSSAFTTNISNLASFSLFKSTIWDKLESDNYKLTRFPFDRLNNDSPYLCNLWGKKQLAR